MNAKLFSCFFIALLYQTICLFLKTTLDMNPKIVSERLGHASTTLTMDIYSHVLPDMQQEASDKLQEVFYSND